MKKNYLVSYFKSFGIIATLAVIILFAVAGVFLYQMDFLKENYATLAQAAIIAVMFGGAIIGFSGLRHDRVNVTDFIRVSFFVANIVLGVLALVSGAHMVAMIMYFAAAFVFLVEVIVRFTAITADAGQIGMKAYFSALGYRYNPICLVVLGMAVAVVLGILGKNGVLAKLYTAQTKFYILGGAAALLGVLLVSAMDRDSDTNWLDAILTVVFVGSIYSPAILAASLTAPVAKALLIIILLATSGLIVRSVFYNKDIIYDTNRDKARTYYRNIFSKYNVLAAVVISIIAIGLVAIATAYALGTGDLYRLMLNNVKLPAGAVTVYLTSGIALLIGLVLTALLFVFRNFRSTEPIKTDWVLISLILATGLGLPFFISMAITDFTILTSNILLLVVGIAYIVFFILGVVIQILRIRNFDPMAAVIAKEAEEKIQQKKEEKQAAKEAEEQAEREEKERKEKEDPFALTEEDEAIYAAEYGEEEKKEEEPEEQGNPYEEEEAPAEEEAAEEEVVEEEAPAEEEAPTEEEAPAEETQDEFDAFLNSVPEKEEAPAEEAAPAAEEAPAEEAEEDAEEAEEEDEEEEEENPYDEEEEAQEEEAPEHEKTLESSIEVQEYVAVDENGQPKKIKRKFNTKMMFAPYETKEYYNEVKNYLMMYRAKGRCSARCESFRYKGLVAKLALGGKAIKVFLALDPAIIEQYPKYRLKDVSEKKQYAEVPVMIKVRSDRALKYCKELIDLMFANRLVKPKRNFEPTNFITQLIPNGEAILGNLGMEAWYLQDTMNVNGIPEEMPDDLIDYLPMIPGDPLDEEEEEAVVYLDTLCLHFEEGSVIQLDMLKSAHICQKGNILRVKARGTLDRKLIIYAEKFDDDALKMILCTNGTAIRIVRDEQEGE